MITIFQRKTGKRARESERFRKMYRFGGGEEREFTRWKRNESKNCAIGVIVAAAYTVQNIPQLGHALSVRFNSSILHRCKKFFSIV